MRLAVMLEPQEGLTYDDLLAVAQRVEAVGLDGLYRSDHYSTVTGGGGLASTDAWATLAGLARETSGIRLGTLVSPVTFRPAGNLAKVVATVSEMAGTRADGQARIVLGMGTGWLEAEHRQHGFPFEEIGVRFDRLEEHLRAVTALWDPERDPVDLDGSYVRLQGAVFRPKPQPRPRLVVGGGGMRRTPALAARYADELNNVLASPQRCGEQRAALDAACEAEGRDPATVGYSLMTGCVVGATTQEFQARVRRLRERTGADLSEAWVLGTPEQAADYLGALASNGVEAVMLQHLLYDDLDMIDLITSQIGPKT
jgi:alkanesulfonate monooxygenase SsuD/methylene tetrahydromethanopterin reductase-like flavin-dependent oxidoreductase (luciferase family)